MKADPDEFYYLPFYNVSASAGPGLLAEDKEPLPMAFRKYFVKTTLKVSASGLFLMKVAGASMSPTLQGGDVIMVNRSDTRLADGIYVIQVDQEMRVKRLQTLPGGQVMVISDNRAFDAFNVPASELAVVGRVVWFGRGI